MRRRYLPKGIRAASLPARRTRPTRQPRRPDYVAVFHQVKAAVRDLARAGRVILIGHGSVYLTRDIPGGVHIRLIAPLGVRIKNAAARFQLSSAESERYLRRLDRQRRTFLRRFWPDLPLTPEMFTAVFNSAQLGEESLAKAISSIIYQRPRVPSPDFSALPYDLL